MPRTAAARSEYQILSLHRSRRICVLRIRRHQGADRGLERVAVQRIGLINIDQRCYRDASGGYDVMVACQLPKLNARVRFPLPAPSSKLQACPRYHRRCAPTIRARLRSSHCLYHAVAGCSAMDQVFRHCYAQRAVTVSAWVRAIGEYCPVERLSAMGSSPDTAALPVPEINQRVKLQSILSPAKGALKWGEISRRFWGCHSVRSERRSARGRSDAIYQAQSEKS